MRFFGFILVLFIKELFVQGCDCFYGVVSDETQLGDRMLDSLSLATLFFLHNSTTPCTIFWQPNRGSYHNQFSAGHCDVRIMDTKILFSNATYADIDFVKNNIPSYARSCVFDIQKMSGDLESAGNNNPIKLSKLESVRALLKHKHFWLERVIVSTYRNVGKMSQLVESHTDRHYVQEMQKRSNFTLIGIHVRLKDKIPTWKINYNEEKYFTERSLSEEIINRVLRVVNHLVHRTNSFRPRLYYFLAIDDESRFYEIASRIESVGGIVVNKDRERKSVLGDFFTLASCDIILQAVKYSTFSIAAAIVGGSTLFNFAPLHNNALLQWVSALKLNVLETDF